MVTLGPALSVAYKSLAGGESWYRQDNMIGEFGLNDPYTTRKIGFGLSQFANATLPWFQDPGYPNRVYGFNMHVATENVSAMLDSPTVDYANDLRRSLKPRQFMVVTATVPAIVCEINARLDRSIDDFKALWQKPRRDGSGPSSAETWVALAQYHIGMLMPVQSDNTNIVIANWDDQRNETFGSNVRQYVLSRQNYTGTWRVSQTSIELLQAIPSYQRTDDQCLMKSNHLALSDRYINVFHEYDWRYRLPDRDPKFYRENIKNDATLLASMVWSRLAALAGIVVNQETPNPGCDLNEGPILPYKTNVTIKTVTVAIKPGWTIILVLALYPTILLTSLVLRVIVWPRSPIAEGFGLISLLASVEKGSLALLGGAGLSGKVDRPIFVGFSVVTRNDDTDVTRRSNIITFFSTKVMRSERLKKGIKYS
ncbi:MAG: hypothetical protein Q9178_007317 [Gyalolechia marmorata]